jgi:transcriptional regulator with XRE-family HTH domain
MAASIRRLRHKHELSQRQLAERAGIDRSYLARLENEALNISVNVVFAIAKTFNTHPCELFEEQGLEESSSTG